MPSTFEDILPNDGRITLLVDKSEFERNSTFCIVITFDSIQYRVTGNVTSKRSLTKFKLGCCGDGQVSHCENPNMYLTIEVVMFANISNI